MTRGAVRLSAGARLERIVASAPDRALLLLFWLTVAVAVTTTFEVFRPWVVAPLWLVLVFSTWRLAPRPLPSGTRGEPWTSAVVLVGCAVWAALNVPYAARSVVALRDPGFLTLRAIWLTDHSNPDIPAGAATQVVGQVRHAFGSSGAFTLDRGMLHTQGADTLPGLLAIGGWIGGQQAVLATNVLLGAMAILGVFALARRLVGSPWAVVPTVALAVSLPLLAFSRGAYTEPVVSALVLGGLVMLWSAFSTRRRSDLVLAGAMVAAGALVRVDGAATLTGLFLGIGLVIGAGLLPRRRRELRIGYLLMVGAAGCLLALGFLGLHRHSPGYLHSLAGEVRALLVATVAAALVGLALTVSRPWTGLRVAVHRHRSAAATILGTVTALLGVALATRPWWLVEQRTDPDSAYAGVVQALQVRAGVPVDVSRSYDEQTLSWLAWYLGWPTVALAVAGLALMGAAAVRRRDPRLMALVAVIGAPTLLYLVRVSITPDQVWAMRRFLPVALPGLLVAATWVLAQASARVGRGRARPAAAMWSLRAGAAVAGAVVALTPVVTWSPLVRSPEYTGQLQQVREVCRALSDAGTGRVVYINAGMPWLGTLRVLCDVDVVEFRGPTTQRQLAATRAIWDGEPVALITLDPALVSWAADPPPPVSTATITIWEQVLNQVPRETTGWMQSVWIGTLQDDGLVAAAP